MEQKFDAIIDSNTNEKVTVDGKEYYVCKVNGNKYLMPAELVGNGIIGIEAFE